jgi:hypothetical protein
MNCLTYLALSPVQVRIRRNRQLLDAVKALAATSFILLVLGGIGTGNRPNLMLSNDSGLGVTIGTDEMPDLDGAVART